MKKLIHTKINHVLMILGAKKKEILLDVYISESETANYLFLNPGEIPIEIQADEETQRRFYQYMELENEIDLWVERRNDEIRNPIFILEEIKTIVHQDMLNFQDRINTI